MTSSHGIAWTAGESSPLPWSVDTLFPRLIGCEVPGLADGYDGYTIAETRFHSLISTEEAAANAFLIVTAVNAYPSLLARIAEMEEVVGRLNSGAELQMLMARNNALQSALTAAEQRGAKAERDTIRRCADFLAREYPDNPNTNAYCAAIRSLAPAPPAQGTQTGTGE